MSCATTCASGSARGKRLEQGSQARDKVLEQLVDAAEVPAAGVGVVKDEVESREHDMVHSLEPRRRPVRANTSPPRARPGRRSTPSCARRRPTAIKIQLILDAIADAEDVQVGDAELDRVPRPPGPARYSMAPQEFANQIVQAGNLPALSSPTSAGTRRSPRCWRSDDQATRPATRSTRRRAARPERGRARPTSTDRRVSSRRSLAARWAAAETLSGVRLQPSCAESERAPTGSTPPG